jgi:hypothetical protein
MYADSGDVEWQDFRSGSRRKVLDENPETGQLTMFLQWDAGYRMGAIRHTHPMDAPVSEWSPVVGWAPKPRRCAVTRGETVNMIGRRE